MKNEERQLNSDDGARSVFHPVTPEDRVAMTAMRSGIEGNKGRLRGPAARGPYDEIMNQVAAPTDVTYEADSVAGIPGWWCRPANATSGAVICHLHGGWFSFGSAQAFRHLVGHIASKSGVVAFIPDYRLAPEAPFPAAVSDVRACFGGLVVQGFRKIAFTGDSAGGGLALVLLSSVQSEAGVNSAVMPVGAVVLSPVTDLALTGSSWEDKAEADPYFTKPQATELVDAYLGDHDPMDPKASPLYGELHGLPPIRVHVGEDEVLLDDSRRYVERAFRAGVDARVDIWEGMAHGFLSGIGKLAASSEALDAIGVFLRERLTMTQGN